MALLFVGIFIIGYAIIALEHTFKINKAATALSLGVLGWITVVLNSGSDFHYAGEALESQMGELAGILFFLLGAMTIVETIDLHGGFRLISSAIKFTNQRSLLWFMAFLTFFLSAILDNLTATIVMISLVQKIIGDQSIRFRFVGIIVIAANAGGAWSPIGDVTTTMLWIGGQISVVPVIIRVLFPSLVCMILPLIWLSLTMPKSAVISDLPKPTTQAPSGQVLIFALGTASFMIVPGFKVLTGLPPFMGILIGLSALWLVTEIMHKTSAATENDQPRISQALRKIDAPTILFFMGILLAVGALQALGILKIFADWLSQIGLNTHTIAGLFGLLSAIVDNVPLVAATQSMYGLNQIPTDDSFWHFLAYTTGTGGSVLIIGSAAGVVAMGMEKISFGWYMRHISGLAFLGYAGGMGAYFLQQQLF